MDRAVIPPRRPDPLSEALEHEVVRAGLDRVLRMVREHLGMDVAFIARFRRRDRVFEHVDAEGEAPIAQGQALSLEEGYCRKVVRGELPSCIPDTSAVAAAMEIEATHALPIGAHLSVPIRVGAGAVYGTLCCFSRRRDPTLGEREMRMMHAFADVIAARIEEATAADRGRRHELRELRFAMSAGAPRMVFQPISAVEGGGLKGVEALARFDRSPARAPDVWFEMARRVGLDHALEIQAVVNALPALDRLPPPVFLGINVSPGLILSGRLLPLLETVDTSRIMLEVTEHAIVADYESLVRALAPLRRSGLRLAVDDAGAGFASMRHILNLAPSTIKLDMSLTRDIDTDGRRRALARGLIAFAHEIGSSIVAEGIETASELDMLRGLGADLAQGFFLHRPMPIDEVAGGPDF